MESLNKVKTARSANFTREEIDLILDSLEACPQLVTGEIGGKFPTKHHHKLAWEALAQRLQEDGAITIRTGDQVKSKWQDMQTRLRKKIIKLMKGNVGNIPKLLTDTENRVTSIMRSNFNEKAWFRRVLLIQDHLNATNHAANFDWSSSILRGIESELSDEESPSKHGTSFLLSTASNEASSHNWSRNSLREIESECSDKTLASNKASNHNWSSKILREIESDISDKESPSKNGISTEFKPKKRKLEEAFEKRAASTQDRMASDIHEIKLSIIEMNNNINVYMKRIDQKFDKMLDLLAVALNVEPHDIKS